MHDLSTLRRCLRRDPSLVRSLDKRSESAPGFAYDRVRGGELMPGVFLVSDQMPKGQAIEELLLAVECLSPEDCKDQVRRFPL